MDARRVDSLLRRHAVVDDVERGLQRDADDARTARRTEHHEGLAVLGHQRRRHRRQRLLLRRNGVGSPLHEAVEILHALLDGEIVHLVVEEEPRSRRNDHGAEAAVDRVGRRYRIAILIDDRIVRRLGRFVRRLARLYLGRGRRRVGDLFPDRRSVFLGEQTVERILDERRIAQERVAIHEGMPHGFGHHMHRRRRVKAHPLQVITFKRIENLAHRRAARTRWRRGMKDVAAIVAGDRLALAHRVGSEISRRQQTAVQLRGRLDRPRNFAFVKDLGPVLGDRR